MSFKSSIYVLFFVTAYCSPAYTSQDIGAGVSCEPHDKLIFKLSTALGLNYESAPLTDCLTEISIDNLQVNLSLEYELNLIPDNRFRELLSELPIIEIKATSPMSKLNTISASESKLLQNNTSQQTLTGYKIINPN